MSVSKPWLDAGCISAALTGCVSDSECAAARRCLLRPQAERLPPNPHEIGLQAATRALVGTFGPHHSRQMTERAVAAYLSALSAARFVVVPAELLRELADDLAGHIAAHYGGSVGYPSMDRKRNRDMEPVNRARAMLAAEEADHD